jgi:transcriptional regulator with XRE-family HTH domain
VPARTTPQPALRRLSERIRQLRTAKNWTQEDLAGECGLDRSYVSGLEVGRRNPTYLNLLKIAKTFGITLVTVLDFSTSCIEFVDGRLRKPPGRADIPDESFRKRTGSVAGTIDRN